MIRKLQNFFIYFGQNADDSGKSTREKILPNVVKSRLERLLLLTFALSRGSKSQMSKDPGICFGKAIYRLHMYRRNPRMKQGQNQSKRRPTTSDKVETHYKNT